MKNLSQREFPACKGGGNLLPNNLSAKRYPLNAMLIVLLYLVLPLSAQAATYYVFFLNGNDNNPGTIDAPFRTIHKGIDTANAGDTIKVNFDVGGSNYQYIPLSRVGTESKPADYRYLKKGVLDVTLFGADPTGSTDSTLAIQHAVNSARDYQLAAFFPNQANGERGVYLVSDTIKCFMKDQIQYDVTRMKPNVLIGSTKGVGRPIIKLQANRSKFSNPGNPVPLIRFWAKPGFWTEYAGKEDPQYCEDDVSFDQVFKGIDIDLGGNPGAYAIRHAGAQGSAIEDVRIDATGAFAGLSKFGVLGWAAYNVEVEGGQYAVYSVCDGDIFSVYNGHGILIGCTFKNQTKSIFCFSNTAAPVLLAGFHIVQNQGVVLNIGGIYAERGGISFIDGIIEMNGGQIFNDNDTKNKFNVRNMRNVYVKGADSVASGWTVDDKTRWTWIKEYTYTDGEKYNKTLVDGNFNANYTPFEYKSKVENVNVSLGQLINGLVKKHLWDEAFFPSFEDSDAVDVKDMGINSAKGDGVTDDTAALQYAIAHYDKIFLSKGVYLVSDTLTLKSNTKLFGIGTIFSQIRPIASWNPAGEAIILTTEDAKDAKTLLAFLSVNNHQYREISGGGGFTPIQWRAGRNSMTRNVMSGVFAEQWQATGENINYHRFRINNNGGGRHFSPLGRWGGARNGNNRGLLIENTEEPLYMYAFNNATDPLMGVEIKNSKNVHFYYPTHEEIGTSMRIDHCKNISVFTEYNNNETGVDRGGVEVFESDNVLIVDSVHSHNAKDTSDRPALIEKYGQETNVIPDDAEIALFKRGDPGFDTLVLYGDVSGDGIISAYDAALAVQAVINLITFTPDQTKAADVSGDGKVTAYDAAMIAKRVVGLIDKFPVGP